MYKRQERIMRNGYLDVMGKFAKEESRAYIAQRDDARDVYTNQLVRYSKQRHLKMVADRRANMNTPYMFYTEKIMAKLAEQPAC